MEELYDHQFIHHVAHSEPFRMDGEFYYRFQVGLSDAVSGSSLALRCLFACLCFLRRQGFHMSLLRSALHMVLHKSLLRSAYGTAAYRRAR